MSHFERCHTTGDWSQDGCWRRTFRAALDPATTERQLTQLIETFPPDWLRSELHKREPHPIAALLCTPTPDGCRALLELSGWIDQFQSHTGFRRLRLRDSNEFPHARCCLEVAHIYTGVLGTTPAFEQPIRPKSRPHDVVFDDGRNLVVIEVKAAREGKFERTVRAQYRSAFFADPEGFCATEIELRTIGLDRRLRGELSEEAYTAEILELVSGQRELGGVLETAHARVGARDCGFIGGASYDQARAARRFIGNLLEPGLKQLPSEAPTLLVFAPPSWFIALELLEEFIATATTEGRTPNNFLGLTVLSERFPEEGGSAIRAVDFLSALPKL